MPKTQTIITADAEDLAFRAAEEYQGKIRIEELCQLGDRLSPLGLVEAFCALSRHRFYQNRSIGGRCWRLRQDFLFHSRIFMLR
jgi:hypothetical protein